MRPGDSPNVIDRIDGMIPGAVVEAGHDQSSRVAGNESLGDRVQQDHRIHAAGDGEHDPLAGIQQGRRGSADGIARCGRVPSGRGECGVSAR